MYYSQITDAKGRKAFAYTYSLRPTKEDEQGEVIESYQIDSGTSTVIYNANGQPVEQNDAKGSFALHAYDALGRPTHMWARDVIGESVTLRHRMEFGETQTNPKQDNLRGKLYRLFDEAGLVTINSYDFKGNPLSKQRKVIADSEILSAFSGPPTNWDVPTYRVDWTGKDATSSILDSFVYQTDMEYDALDRVTKMIYPQDQDSKRKVYHPTYNKAGNLQSVDMEDDQGSGNFTNYVKELAYDAKGQRLLIAFGNGLMTRYTYDSKNFRLVRLKSEKYAYSYDSTNNTHTYSPQSGTTFQDYAYEYDLVGNILHLTDKTPTSKKGPGDLTKDYLYDPLYRLLSATGRECDKPMKQPPWEDQVPYCHDPTATRNYTREYTYDKMGNITKLHHVYGNSSYNRDFAYISNKNLLDKITMGSTDYQFSFDSNGNQVQENSSRFFEWDHSDQMRAFYVQASSGSEPSVYTHYLYDGGGNRIKKLTRKDSGKVEVTVYIDDVFEESYIKPNGSSIDSNHHWNTLHIMDDSSRVATIRAGTDNNDSTPAFKYNLEDHLGSSSVMVDDSGTLVNREEYYPFGDTSFGGFAKKRYRYTGKEKDEESGLYYYGARYYAPWTCRFISVDPKSRQFPNLTPYNYASNNPIKKIEIKGLQGVDSPFTRSDSIPRYDNTYVHTNPGAKFLPRSSGPSSFDQFKMGALNMASGLTVTIGSGIFAAGTSITGVGAALGGTGMFFGLGQIGVGMAQMTDAFTEEPDVPQVGGVMELSGYGFTKATGNEWYRMGGALLDITGSSLGAGGKIPFYSNFNTIVENTRNLNRLENSLSIISESAQMYSTYKTIETNFQNVTKSKEMSYTETITFEGNIKQTFTSVQITEYTIQQGDTLSEIAQRFNTDVQTLKKMNKNIQNVDEIYAGDKIKVRSEKTKKTQTIKNNNSNGGSE